MRDPDRIDAFCKELAAIWKENAPDWRFGQLIYNVIGKNEIDPFFLEEQQMIIYFQDYFNKLRK